MLSSEDNPSQSKNFEFNNYKSLVSAEIELIQRVFEIRHFFQILLILNVLFSLFCKEFLKYSLKN
jgi:hypothetical protein